MNLARRPTQKSVSLDEAAMPVVLDALHCLRVAITIFDSAERLVFANEHFNYLFRSLPPREDLLGRTYEEMIRLEIAGGEITASEVLDDLEGFVARRRAQLLDGDYQPRDIRLADGRVIEIKARRSPAGGWVALWTDVTQARRALGRLETTIALSVDAFAFFDRNDTLALCNEEYAAVVGASVSKDLVGRRFEDLANQLASGGSIVTTGGADAWLARRLDMHRVPAGAMTIETSSGTAYLVRDRATEDGGRVVVFTDATEHHRTEKTLVEQTQTLDKTRRALASSQAETTRQATYLADLTTKLDQASAEADTTKTTLLRTMSHELKTPLNAIIGFSDLLGSLAGQAGPEQVKEYAGLIHQGGRNLLKLINQILDLTKLSAGRYELRRQPVDAGAVLWQAKDAFEARAAAKAIEIDADECPLGLLVDADENVFTAMAQHLIENAVEFTQTGGLVRLSVKRAGAIVKIAVSDNGPGVAAPDLERILRPFEQGGRGTADHPAGAGLGLTLVKAFSELHGGSLTVQSAANKGFTATIALPVATA